MEDTEIAMPEENENNMPEENKTGFLQSRNGKIVLGVAVVVLLCTCSAVVVWGIIVIAGNIQLTQFGL